MKDKFYRNVNKTDSCWLWTGSLSHGYGRMQIKGKRELAHRLSWTIHRGSIPEGLNVCHTCDTPNCVNPDHLFLGTQSDNMLDASVKGRMKYGRPMPSGDKHPNHKLSSEQIIAIRCNESNLSVSELSVLYGVSRTHIRDILNRKKWSHL